MPRTHKRRRGRCRPALGGKGGGRWRARTSSSSRGGGLRRRPPGAWRSDSRPGGRAPRSRRASWRGAASGEGADYVVVTEKDAVQLRDPWPADAPEPLVAVLQLHWELNGAAVERALDGLLR